MEELTLEGKRYISSKRAAEVSGYTKDYVGQLARAGALDAKMVGRSWYIEGDAIENHKKLYQGKPVVDQSIDQPTEEGILDDSFALEKPEHKDQPNCINHSSLNELFMLKYESDTRPLIPETSTKESYQVASEAEDATEETVREVKVPIGEEDLDQDKESNEGEKINTSFVPKNEIMNESKNALVREEMLYTAPRKAKKTKRYRNAGGRGALSSYSRKAALLIILILVSAVVASSLTLIELAQTYAYTETGYEAAERSYYLKYVSNIYTAITN